MTDSIPLEQAEYVAHKDPLDQNKNLFKISNGQPEARTLEYFKSVNSSTIERLYQCYKIDFELFKYNLEGLLWLLLEWNDTTK